MIDDKVNAIVRSLSEGRNKNFFPTIVKAMCRAIDAKYVFIAQVDDTNTAHTIAISANGELAENFSYSLEYTPCAEVSQNKTCIYNNTVQSAYPNDQLLIDMGIHGYIGIPLFDSMQENIGIVVALYEDVIEDVRMVESIFMLFSGLMGGELERRSYVDQLMLSSKVINGIGEGVLICDIKRQIISVNPSFEKITGYREDEVLGKKPNLLSSGKHCPEFYQALWKSIEENGWWSGEIWNRRKNGETYPEWLTIDTLQNEHGELTHYVGFFFDITRRKAAEEKIHFQANFDSLTHLANRDKFFDFCCQSIHQATRNKSGFAVFFIDLDIFKAINDGFGHKTGDQLLIEVAQRIKHTLRENDLAARHSGDEFTLLISEIHRQQDAIIVAEKLKNLLQEPIFVDEQQINITASFGIAIYPNDGKDADTLLNHADQAMYQAKAQGRNRYMFFTRELERNAKRRIEIKQNLQTALNQNQLSLAFQPIVNLRSKRIDKIEALVRWQRGNEFVPPLEFIQIAEDFALIDEVGNFVLHESCRQLRQLHESGYHDLIVCINRSIKEFPLRTDATPNWLDVIASYGLLPSSICFEITESILAQDNDAQLSYLHTLKSSGCKIAIDDFGTGYSSLSYIQRFPIDVLKVDQSFIKNDSNKNLVAAIIAMGKSLNLDIVVEGVEQKEQVQYLENLDCEFVQGYYFSRPLNEENLLKFLEKNKGKRDAVLT